jgi:hypothetical protein
MSAFRRILGLSRFRWWCMIHLPGWPWKQCVVCGKRFRRKPWWNANPFEEHCSRKCADVDLAIAFVQSGQSARCNPEKAG